MPVPEAGASQLPVGTEFGSVFWHQAGAELSAGSRVALEMVPGSTRARKIKKEKRSEEKRDFIGLETVSEVGQGVWWILLGSVGFPGMCPAVGIGFICLFLRGISWKTLWWGGAGVPVGWEGAGATLDQAGSPRDGPGKAGCPPPLPGCH